MRQLVRYSEDYAILLDAFETANEAEVVFGSLEEVKTGTVVFVYVVVPYNRGKNVYFAVETTGKDNIKVTFSLREHKTFGVMKNSLTIGFHLDSFTSVLDRA